VVPNKNLISGNDEKDNLHIILRFLFICRGLRGGLPGGAGFRLD